MRSFLLVMTAMTASSAFAIDNPDHSKREAERRLIGASSGSVCYFLGVIRPLAPETPPESGFIRLKGVLLQGGSGNTTQICTAPGRTIEVTR